MRAQPSSTRIRVAREAFLSGEDTPRDVRTEIVESWRRSKLSGVDADRLEVPFFADFEPECNKLFLAAKPILERAERLLDANSSVVLADRRARVLGRWSGDHSLDRGLEQASVARGFLLSEGAAGTNGVGTAVEERRPVTIVGSEHFAEQFSHFTCVGAPIRHPMTRQIVGVLDIACRELEPNRLLLPMAMELASEIEQELYLHASERERALLESFLREVTTSTRPVVSISEQLMMANAAAARLLDGTDQVVLWEQASLAVTSQRERSIEFTLADGRPVRARCKPVEVDSRTIGVVVELDPHALEATAARRRQPPSVAARGDSLVGQTPAWREAEALTRRVAATGLPILFLGEPGTGKAALARFAHEGSGDAAELTVVDCALFGVDGATAWLQRLRDRLAGAQGTVLLRRVDQLDDAASMAICAVLDADHGVGVRLLATATAASGSDPDVPRPLLDRLGVTRVALPPLRQRPEDIALLAGEFVRRHAPRRPLPRFAPEVLQVLLRLDWPGNVRQLENLVRALVAAGRLSDIRLEDLPEEIRRQTARRPLSRLEQTELDEILAALRQVCGNKLLAAATLGISRSTLYRKLRGFGIEIDRVIF